MAKLKGGLMFFLIFLTLSVNTELKITKKTMENDLRVIFIEDHTLPIFGGIVQFDVGSCYERPGITGVSHLLEHMLFKGTKKIGTTNYEEESLILEIIHKLYSKLAEANSIKRDKILEDIEALKEGQKDYIIPSDIWTIYFSHGGYSMNAFTSNTTTQYFLILPSNKKEVWAKIESDRFQNPIFREFYSERDVVNEERRMYESIPMSVLYDHLMANSYLAAPIRWSVIGWTSDIMNVTPEEVMEYYRTYYIPERCILVLAGDVDPDEDFKMIKDNFGSWGKKTTPLIRLPEEPEQLGFRRAHVNFKAQPQMAIGFHGPWYGEHEYYATCVLRAALAGGESSILSKTIVKKGIVPEIDTSFVESWEGKARSIMCFMLRPMKDLVFKNVEDEFFSVLDSLRENGISNKDLRRAKNNLKMNIIIRRRFWYPLWIGMTIGNGERVMGDPEFYKKELKIIESITNEDVMDILKNYIRKDKSTVVTLGEEDA